MGREAMKAEMAVALVMGVVDKRLTGWRRGLVAMGVVEEKLWGWRHGGWRAGSRTSYSGEASNRALSSASMAEALMEAVWMDGWDELVPYSV